MNPLNFYYKKFVITKKITENFYYKIYKLYK